MLKMIEFSVGGNRGSPSIQGSVHVRQPLGYRPFRFLIVLVTNASPPFQPHSPPPDLHIYPIVPSPIHFTHSYKYIHWLIDVDSVVV